VCKLSVGGLNAANGVVSRCLVMEGENAMGWSVGVMEGDGECNGVVSRCHGRVECNGCAMKRARWRDGERQETKHPGVGFRDFWI
jgi:hypothetical protein